MGSVPAPWTTIDRWLSVDMAQEVLISDGLQVQSFGDPLFSSRFFLVGILVDLQTSSQKMQVV